MTSTLNSRLSSLLPPSIISRKGALALSSCAAGPGVDGLRWWIDCQPNPTVSFFKLLSVVTLSSLMFCKQLQFELRLLLFLLEDHIFSGDLWRLVMAHHIEIMQEAQLHKPEMQPQNHSGGARFSRELELLEDKRDRARLELSLYSQAMDVFQPQLACMYTVHVYGEKYWQFKARHGLPVIQLPGGDRRFPGTVSRVGPAGLRQTDLVHMKCSKWLSGISSDSTAEGGLESAMGTAPATVKEPTSVASKLMAIYTTLVLPAVSMAIFISLFWYS